MMPAVFPSGLKEAGGRSQWKGSALPAGTNMFHYVRFRSCLDRSACTFWWNRANKTFFFNPACFSDF